jgi:hypothetical protein
LWEGWKGASHSDEGMILQAAISDELGGRLRDSGKYAVDLDEMKASANANYPFVGGFEGVKAIVRAKWEATQYMLDKAGKQDVQLFRGLNIDGARDTKTETVPNEHTGLGHIRLPEIRVLRNGAASTTVNRGVANNWINPSGDGVVLRFEVPRTSVISVPAYGQNIHNEQEVILGGLAWKGWDAWRQAPSFKEVPIGHHRG